MIGRHYNELVEQYGKDVTEVLGELKCAFFVVRSKGTHPALCDSISRAIKKLDDRWEP